MLQQLLQQFGHAHTLLWQRSGYLPRVADATMNLLFILSVLFFSTGDPSHQ